MECNIAEFIDENMVRLKITTPLGKVTKHVTFDSYVEALVNARNHTMPKPKNKNIIITDTPILPSSNGVSVVQHRMFSDGSDWTVLLREPIPIDMPWGDDIIEHVHVPKLLFAVKRIDKRYSCMKIAALPSTTLQVKEDTKIYYYPFTNVGAPYNSACIGVNGEKVNKVLSEDLISIHSIPNIFLAMPAVNHGYKDVNLSELEMRPLLNELKDKPFPDEWLKPSVEYGAWFGTFN